MLYSSQFGFRPHLSTSRAVFNTLQYIYNNLDKGSVVIFFAKAVYSVDHEILLRKLSKYEVRGTALKVCRFYLADRKQFVAINWHNSHFSSNKSAIPKVSIFVL